MASIYEKYNDSYAEMARNAGELRKTKKIYNAVGLFYIVVLAIYLIPAMESILSPGSDDPLYQFLNGVVFKLVTCFYGYFACYKHNSLYAVIAALAQTACSLLSLLFMTEIVPRTLAADVPNPEDYTKIYMKSLGLNVVVLVMVVILTVATIIANRKYLYLSEQTGFPYFSQRVTESEMDRRQMQIKDPYTISKEQLRKSSSSDMPDPGTAAMSDLSAGDTPTKGTMDEI